MASASDSSPEYLRISLAAAMSLGLRSGVFYRGARLHCLNLLLTYPEGCAGNCSYCGLARRSRGEYADRSFIRVEWPAYHRETILAKAKGRAHFFERVCLSMIMHPSALDDALVLTEQLDRELGLPVSVLINPTAMGEGDIESLRRAGADMASVALDAATEDLFGLNRGDGANGPHRWDRYWRALEEAAIVFGRDRFGCHLIAGLGETERELLDTVARLRAMGGRTHLFSFYPETGSARAGHAACPAEHFRRVQLGRFLIDYDIVDFGRMEFDDRGRVVGFGLRGADLDQLVDSGIPFMTSGCPGKTRLCACNRPFGDGPPSDIRSFPFSLDSKEILTVKKQLATYPAVEAGKALDV